MRSSEPLATTANSSNVLKDVSDLYWEIKRTGEGEYRCVGTRRVEL